MLNGKPAAQLLVTRVGLKSYGKNQSFCHPIPLPSIPFVILSEAKNLSLVCANLLKRKEGEILRFAQNDKQSWNFWHGKMFNDLFTARFKGPDRQFG